MESFDIIYYAALQVVIVSSANGVRGSYLTSVLRELTLDPVVTAHVSDDGL